MPRRDRRAGDRWPFLGGRRPSSPIWYVLGFLIVMALVQVWFMPPTAQSISYSEFKTAIRASQVAEVTLG